MRRAPAMLRWLVLASVALCAVTPGRAQGVPRPRITGISHVAFRVTDAAAARRFYGDLMGLGERLSPGQGVIFYSIGARQHVRIEPGLPPGTDERLSHVAFETTDVKALASYLTSRGVQVQQPSEGCAPTAIRVADPDGHPIEFVQVNWPPPTLPPSLAESAPSLGAAGALSHRLLHAGLIVKDEETAHRFYRDVLGFSEIWRGGRADGVTDWVNMRVPDGTEYLEYMLSVSATPNRRQRGTAHHMCLLVPDIQSAWETVARRTPPAGRAQLSPPNVGRNGRWQLNLFDPDETRTELMEPFRVR